jgi:tetratricopeptide (TPR) repeat protein
LGEVPDNAATTLLSPYEGAPQTFVQATLPDGERGLFLFDTGAGVSVLSATTAERLGLTIAAADGSITGLGGSAPYHEATIPTLSLAGVTIENVEVAVDVPGVPTHINALEIDGILGNNVWSLLSLEIDYPAHELRLHKPDTRPLPANATKMSFDGQHIFSMGTLKLHDNIDEVQFIDVMLQIDTGAGELLISGDLPSKGSELDFSEGLESVYGLGAAAIIPPSEFVVQTRRIALDAVSLGGSVVDMRDHDVRWVNFEGARSERLQSVRALAGHDLLKRHCVELDFKNERMALRKSRTKARKASAHALLLSQETEQYGNRPERGLIRAALHTALARQSRDPNAHLLAAGASLQTFIENASNPSAIDTAKLHLADNLRNLGLPTEALSVARSVSPENLARSGKFLETTHALLNIGEIDEAIRITTTMVNTIKSNTPLRTQGFLLAARSDAYAANDNYTKAHEDLVQAADLLQNPDAFLMRKARLAWLRQDIAGTNANLRRMLEAFPSQGEALWLYRLVNRDTSNHSLHSNDILRAIKRVQPAVAPLDFQVGALSWLALPNKEITERGIKRDCTSSSLKTEKDNCIGWYYTLSGTHLFQARWRINRTLRAQPHRPDYLDTLAVFHYTKGQLKEAAETATAAVILDPGNIYMLWQRELIQKAASR